MSPSTGPSWRGPANKPPAGSSRSWRRPGRGSVTAWNPRNPLLKTLMSALSALAAVVVVVAYIYLVFVPGCNQTEFTVIAPAPYTDSAMPPHSFAKEDADMFREQFSVKKLTSLASLDTKSDESLASQKPLSLKLSSHKTQIVYVTALAGQLENGVVLYATGAGPDSEASEYLPLKQLWNFLAAMPNEQTKLLVIDIASGPVDWRWGQFARPQLGSASEKDEVNGLVTDPLSRIPNLAVLTSVAPGEASWTSPILRRSVFAHFLVQGLAGKADEKADGGNHDSRVTLDELYNFVLTRTNHWVEQNRDPRGQHPQLLSSPEQRRRMMNVVIAEVHGKIREPSSATSKSVETPELDGKIDHLWSDRDEWSEKGAGQWHPLAWRQLLEALRRAEQRWLAGQREEMSPHVDAAENAVKALQEQFERRKRYSETGLALRDTCNVFSRQNLVRPEEHLKKMFAKFAPPALDNSQDVRDSCAQRSFAEEQSWHSFRSRLWAGSFLKEADQERRYAEDLLFVGEPEERQKSSVKRAAAAAKLEQHRKIVKSLVEIEFLHHRLLTELPELAWWAAQRIPHEMISKPAQGSKRFLMMSRFFSLVDPSNSRPKTLQDYDQTLGEFTNDLVPDNVFQTIEAEILILFEQARELGRLLDQERDKLAQPFAAEAIWRQERDVVYDGGNRLNSLIYRLRNNAEDLMKAGPTGPESSAEGQAQYYHWLKCRNALQWSGLKKGQRIGLFRALNDSDRSLFENSSKNMDVKSARWNRDDWSSVDGCWQAMWALQTLSLGMPAKVVDQPWGSWNKALTQDDELAKGQLAKIGAWARNEFLSRSVEAKNAPRQTDQLEDAMIAFLKAERAARTIHGYDAISFNLDHDPIPRMHSFDVGALCVVQADRYLEDFWGNLVDNNPWYVEAGDQCLKAAGRQADSIGSQSLKTARKEVEDRFGETKKAALSIVKVDERQVDLTTNDIGKSETTIVEIAIDDRVPAGIAALGLYEDVDPAVSILEFAPAGRQAIAHEFQKHELSKRDFTVQKKKQPDPEMKCLVIQIQPQLLFRGRLWNSEGQRIQVDPCEPKPINREYQAPPKTGEIVVYGVDRRDTIFILDCSESMNYKIGTEKTGHPSRFEVATKALSGILHGLLEANTDQRDKYIVGLVAFGHRLRAGKPLSGNKFRNSKETEKNKDWPIDILDFEGNENLGLNETKTENWKRDCELLELPKPLLEAHFRRMNAYLDPTERVQDRKFAGGFIPQLQPYGETPLLGSIYSTAKYLNTQRQGGLIVVICDGAFNDDGANGDLYNRVKNYYIRHHDRLSLHLVAFDVNKDAEKEALDELAKSAGGKFHKAAKEGELGEVAKKAMTPRKFKVVRDAEPPWDGEEHLGNLVKELEPYTYLVRFEGVQELPAMISGGERLEFDLETANNQFLHRRRPLKPQGGVRINRNAERNEPTKFGYLKAELEKTSTGSVATFQFGLDRDDLSGMVARPKEIRIEISHKGAPRRQFSGSWKLLPDSIPVWEISLRDWPVDPKPQAEVQAFWKMSRTEPGGHFALQDLMKTPQSVAVDEWHAGSLTVTAERQAGRLLVKLESNKNPPGSNVGDLRVELGKLSQVQDRFEPSDFNWTSEFFEKKGGGGKIVYTFDVGDKIDVSEFRVGLTSAISLRRDASELKSKLSIDKWDDKL